ncbi:putative transcriptional regulator [Pelagirhabdus alkalitolerans]|uniref:Putative transcriptional regulator n=1 Tax=Pelagirhabdus alkalitolerans TaxID=1612202 RepID=A0A1G6GL31_9BACI|nr:helix-turn-helix transcriptional regulator [Pelagirhabdus alkalitolerans]SDB82718.1 putative transcriptional regulator [Pelagirhabdus alkalitolerans]
MNKIKVYRKYRGLTQIELAKQVGVARQTINLIENNKYNPSLSLCIALAKALESDLNTLFWEEIDNEGQNT